MGTALPPHAPLPAAGHNSGDEAVLFDQIADHLATQGWCVLRDFIPESELAALSERLAHLREQDILTPAGIGRGRDNTENSAIRRDVTHWLEPHDAAERQFLARMNGLREGLNRRLMLGLFFYEAHFAHYDSGAFYARHRDSFHGQKNRIVSTVLYLNENWKAEDGGLLALYADDTASEPLATIAPERGVFVLFLSEDFPHEVQVAHRPRNSIAGWFRCNDKLASPALQSPVVPLA